MSYSDLSALFKGICDAIRAKDGTTELISHQDIPAKIAALPEFATGTYTNLTGSNISLTSVPAGYYEEDGEWLQHFGDSSHWLTIKHGLGRVPALASFSYDWTQDANAKSNKLIPVKNAPLSILGNVEAVAQRDPKLSPWEQQIFQIANFMSSTTAQATIVLKHATSMPSLWADTQNLYISTPIGGGGTTMVIPPNRPFKWVCA